MEHLSLPKDPVLPLKRIPYLPSNQEVDETFWNQSKIFGNPGDTISEMALESDIFKGLSCYKAAAIIQSIWFFGLIRNLFEKVCQLPYDNRDFVRFEEEQGFIDTSMICQYIERFKCHFRKLNPTRQCHLLDSALKVLETHNIDIRIVEKHYRANDALMVFTTGHDIICSINIMAETISSILASNCDHISYSYDMGDHHAVYADEQHTLKFPPQETIRRRLLERGWCPSEVEYATNCFSLRNQYYISNLRRDDNSKPHTSCTTSRCYLNDSSREAKEPKHRHKSCYCRSLSTSNDQILPPLENNRIPRIHFSPTLPLKDDTGQCEIVEHGKYVAISHVWSQGLGNSQANKLPLCQLLRLKTLVQYMYPRDHPPVHLWIDTLCISAEAEGKRMGLKLLKKAFNEADKILVIDTDLLGIKDQSEEEILIRINCAEWMRRLWTLNEAVVSGCRLHIQLSNRAVDFRTLLGSRFPKATSPDSLQGHPILRSIELSDDVTGHFGKIWSVSEESSIVSRFIKLLPTLHRRRTTVKEDEALCIASALELSLDPLLDCHPTRRMEALFSMIPKIPSVLIFSNAKKLQKFGLYWAPETFLDGDIDFVSTVRSEAFLGTFSGSGIYVQLTGIKLLVHKKKFLQTWAGSFYISNMGQWLFANLVHPDPMKVRFELPNRDKIRGFALATYPSVNQRRAILLGVYESQDTCIEGVCLARYDIGNLANPFKMCAEHIKQRLPQAGHEVSDDFRSLSPEERDKYKRIDTTHEGLFSLGFSAVALNVYRPSQRWLIH